MRKAYVDGILSSFTLIPDETVSVKKLRSKYNEATPSLSVKLNIKDRDNSARTIRKAINRIALIEKGVQQTSALGTKLNSLQNQGTISSSSSHKSFLKEGMIRRPINTISGNDIAEAPACVAVKLVYLDNENGLRDMLAIRNDWLNVAGDMHAARVKLQNENR